MRKIAVLLTLVACGGYEGNEDMRSDIDCIPRMVPIDPIVANGPLRGKKAALARGQSEALIQLSCEPAEASLITVSVDLEIADGALFAEPFLDLLWGLEGGVHRARIDARQGTLFSVLGNSLVVTATNPDFGIFTSAVIISASAAPGGHAASDIKPQRTLRLIAPAAGGTDAVLAPAGTRLFVIPQYAQTLSVLKHPSAQTLNVRFIDTIRIYGSLDIAAGAVADDIEIPNGANQILVTNTGAADITAVSLIFGLAL